MIIFLYGSDSYRIREAKIDIINKYKIKHSSGFNFFDLDLSDPQNISSIEDNLKSISFFGEHKLIVCKNVFSSKKTAEDFYKILKDNSGSLAEDVTILVAENIEEKEATSKSKQLFQILSSASLVKSFGPLSDSKLSEWLKKECQDRNCSIDQRAVKRLMELNGNDSWALINEINKLAAYRKEGMITLADVGLLSSEKISLNIFDFLEALSSKNKPKAFELLYREIKNNQDPYYILSMITYQFRNLLMVKSLSEQGLSRQEIAKKAGMHPFVVGKCAGSAAKFKDKELNNFYSRLAEADILLKAGKKDIRNILDGLVLGL